MQRRSWGKVTASGDVRFCDCLVCDTLEFDLAKIRKDAATTYILFERHIYYQLNDYTGQFFSPLLEKLT